MASDLTIKVGVDSGNINKDVKKLGNSIKSSFTGITAGITAALGALQAFKGTYDFLADSVKLWDKQAQAISLVKTGIESTGNAAKLSLKQLQVEASRLQENTLFGDEAILEGATAQLLTFTNITGKEFKRTQAVVLDLATKLKGPNASMEDLRTTSIQLGKALNDPIGGIGALSRSGIQFSDDQKKVIKQLVKTNQLAKAQSIILGELETQFGGTAKAAAQTGLGPLKQLNNTLGDIQETIGKAVLPAVLDFANVIKGELPNITNLAMQFGKFTGDAIIAVRNNFDYLKDSIILIISPFQSLFNIVSTITGALGGTGDTVSVLTGLIKVLATTTLIAFSPLIALFKTIEFVIVNVIDGITYLIDKVKEVYRYLGLLEKKSIAGVNTQGSSSGFGAIFQNAKAGVAQSEAPSTGSTGTFDLSKFITPTSTGNTKGSVASSDSVTGGANKQVTINIDNVVKEMTISQAQDPREVKIIVENALKAALSDLEI